MSHLNLRFPPELLAMDNEMEAFWEDYRKKIHLVPKFAGERADSPSRLPSPVTPRTAMTSPAKPLSLWARAWLMVAKGIIG